MISADLLDEILAVTPTWDGVYRPPLREEAIADEISLPRSGGEVVEIGPLSEVLSEEASSGFTRRAPRKKLAKMLLRALHERPGISAYDLMMLVRRRGARFNGVEPRNTVERALTVLERDGFARRVQLSGRDEKKYGARFLWEAA